VFQFHTTIAIIPPNSEQPVEVDDGIAALVQALWARGWQTTACCQDTGEATEAERASGRPAEPTGHRGFIDYYRGWAWVKMPRPDAFGMLAELIDHETFGPRVKARWQQGSWRMHIPVLHHDDGFTVAPYVQIYFPKDQIAELARVLTDGRCQSSPTRP
jgi:hypothetical protein